MRNVLVVALCLIGLTSLASAHALLESAVPVVGGTVQVPPKQVAITFSEGVEADFSTIEVTDSAGKRVDSGNPHTAPDNGAVLIVDLQPLGPGSYQVKWRAVSVDTHKTQGSYSFDVAP